MSEKTRYKNPPIVQRILGVYHQLPAEVFEKKLPTWINKIRSEYSEPESLAEWKIDIEERNGIPFVKNLIPKARIIRLFWKKHPKKYHVMGMRLRPDRLVFHLCREEDNSHDFDEVMSEMEKWLPLWAEHFEIKELQGITVEYCNELNGIITPQLINPIGKGIMLEEALNFFGSIPGKHIGVTDPYECTARLVMDDKKPTYLDLQILGERETGSVKVNFTARTQPQNGTLSFRDAISEINIGHDLILEQFACTFTEKAKQSFNL